MKLQPIVIAAALTLAAPAHAVTTSSGTLVPGPFGSTLQATLPDLEAGKVLTVDFKFSGGIPDGGDFLWTARQVYFYRELDGRLTFRDHEQEVGCQFAFADVFPTTCYGVTRFPGARFSSTVRPDGFTATFGLPRDFYACTPESPIGDVCGARHHTRFGTNRGLTLFFVGSEPTEYRLSYAVADIPEPATWTMMIVGLGVVGFSLRSPRRVPFVRV